MDDDVQAIYRPRLLTEILLSLNEGSRKLPQLREITRRTSQALIPKLRKLEADHIYGISSVVTEGYTDAISERVKEGISVELIVPLHVAEELKRSPYLKKIEALKNYENFKLMAMDEDIKVGLIVTDKRLSLNLYKKEAFWVL